MKKNLISIVVIILIIGGAATSYNYFSRGAKISNSVLSKSIDEKGKATEPASTFTSKDTIYFSAKGKKMAIKNATVVWYKGEINTKNRFKVEENIEINNAGYFSAKLSLPGGLEPGHYGVTTYRAGKSVIETFNEFDVTE